MKRKIIIIFSSFALVISLVVLLVYLNYNSVIVSAKITAIQPDIIIDAGHGGLTNTIKV